MVSVLTVIIRQKKSVSSYAQSLRKISDIYAQERKRGASGVVMEDKKHDNFT